MVLITCALLPPHECILFSTATKKNKIPPQSYNITNDPVSKFNLCVCGVCGVCVCVVCACGVCMW